MTPTNWPNPERPGVPMFPERDGAHAIEVRGLEGTDLVYYWHQNGGGWTEYNYQDAEHFLTDEETSGWIYKGPILTPTQLTELLAGERERYAKVLSVLIAEEKQTYGDEAKDILWAYRKALYEIRNLGDAP